MGNASPAAPPPAEIPKKAKEKPKRIVNATEADNDLAIPELQELEDNPRVILLTGLLRIARAADTNYPVEDLYKYFKVNEKQVKTKTILKGETIFRKGQTPDGVYVVQEGELSVFASGKRDEVMRICKKDFAFDVECVYDIKSLYTVLAFNDCTVNFVSRELIHELIKDLQRPHIQYWYISRRLPPNHPKLTPKVVYNKICTTVMKQIPLFAQWQDETIQAFIDYMGETPMVLYRPKTPIFRQGDPGGDMFILVRGKVHAYDGTNQLVTYFVQNIPFAFGEEGIFNENWNHKISVIADSPCYVISINKKWLWHAAEFVWEFAEGAEPYWTEAVQKWWCVLDSRDYELTGNSVYAPYLSIEVIYQWLKCTPSFKNCATRYVYELAKCGTPMVMESHGFCDFNNLEEGCLLVLKGQLELLDSKQMNGITKMRVKTPPTKEDMVRLRKEHKKNRKRTKALSKGSNNNNDKTPHKTNNATNGQDQYNTENTEDKTNSEEDDAPGEQWVYKKEWIEAEPVLFNAQDLIYYRETQEKHYLKANTECLLIKFPLNDILVEMERVRVDPQPIDFLPSLGSRKENAKVNQL